MRKVDWSKWNSTESNFAKYADVKSNLIYGTPSKEVPSVSVMVLTYKRAHGLKRALDTALAQDFAGKYEIAVVDDSGFDQETDDLMKTYCDKYSNVLYYRHEKNIGQYANWNRACELCRTEWFCLLHDDDGIYPNYLSTTMAAIQNSKRDIGLLGVYFNTLDERKNIKKAGIARKTIDTLINTFVKIRNNKPIEITLEDNAKLINVLSCCLMINKHKVIEVGGLDDQYFPSSDFVFGAKMGSFHDVVFLPQILCFRGIAENESLKEAVCSDSIICAYFLAYEIIKKLKPKSTESYKKRKASFAAIAAEIGVLGYNDIDYSKTKTELGMKPIYNSKFTRFCIMLYSRACWGLLLFRK
jgi:Predicted glycosyltransferases